MKLRSILVIAVSFGPIINAQTTDKHLLFPGSAWSVLGNISPVEKGNIIDASYFEQGVRVYHRKSLSLVPYVSIGLTLDTEKYDWNNRVVGQAGIKLNKTFRSGVISLGSAYAHEYRWQSGMTKGAPIGYANYWFGWQQPGTKIRFPGSSWGIVGNISPVEKGNVIAGSYLQQGIAILNSHAVSVVPFAEATGYKDSKHYDWNNRIIYGGGVKLLVRSRPGVTEIGTSYSREKRFNSGLTGKCITIFLKLWFGWNPKAT